MHTGHVVFDTQIACASQGEAGTSAPEHKMSNFNSIFPFTRDRLE